ncbi:MAG: outer membrane beta-barrel protein [Gammaproteobacteria bacterium]
MKTKLRLLPVLCALTLAPVTHALANGYLLASIGNSDDDVLQETATGIKIGMGAMLNENLAVELAYVDLGTIDFPFFGVEISQYGLAASLIPIHKISEQAAVYAKIGLYSWTLEVSDPFGSGEDTGTDLFYGFGFEHKVGDSVAVVAEYEFYEVSDGDVDLLSVGVKIDF